VKTNDDFKREQEIKTAADLKAKLEMVSTRQKPKYGRQVRKIGTMVCNTGFKTGYRNATTSFVLRLDSDTGEFIAEHGDVQYVSKSRDALKAKMDQVAMVTIDLKWSRYLLVKYTATIPYQGNFHSTTTLTIDDPRRKNAHAVLGIHLNWELVEYSDAFELPNQGRRFMKRDVFESGPSSSQETINELPDGLVPYTKEREAILQQLRAALASVDAKMVELFRGDPERVARRLDEMKGVSLLLDAAEPPSRPKKSKR
jgi:hypothetical protein